MNDYYKTCAFPKPQNKKKKRITVSDKTYYKVFNACKGTCVLCGSKHTLQAHHIRYRSERKDLINVPQNMVMLCASCHLKVHKNKKYWQPILLEIARWLYDKKNTNNKKD